VVGDEFVEFVGFVGFIGLKNGDESWVMSNIGLVQCPTSKNGEEPKNSGEQRTATMLDSGLRRNDDVCRHAGLDPASRDKKEWQVFSLELVKDQPGFVFRSDGLRILATLLIRDCLSLSSDATHGLTTNN